MNFTWKYMKTAVFCLNYKFWTIFNFISLELSFQAAPSSWKTTNKRSTKWMQQWYKGCIILCRRYKTAVRMQRYSLDAEKCWRSKRRWIMWHWLDETRRKMLQNSQNKEKLDDSTGNLIRNLMPSVGMTFC